MIEHHAVLPVGQPMHAIGWYHLLLFGLMLPVGAFRSRAHLLGAGVPSLRAHYLTTMALLVFFAVISLYTARQQEIRLALNPRPEPAGVVAGIVVLLAGVLVMWPLWRRAVARGAPTVRLFAPTKGVERVLWVIKSFIAGASEEISWRGVQTALLAVVVRSEPLAIALSILMFTAAHAMQGRRSLPVVACFAASFHLLFWLSGTLLVPMVVHALYDVAAGLAYSRLVRQAKARDRVPIAVAPEQVSRP